MDKQNLIKVKQKKSNNKLLIPLIVVISVLLILNVVLISMAFFSDKATGESIITFGSVETNAYILQGGNKLTSISLDSNDLIAGAVTQKDLHIDVTGKSNCYVRLTGEFKIATDGTNYVNASDLVSFSVDTTTATGWKLCEDGKYYYTSVLNGTETGSASTLSLPIKFTVSNEFGNSSGDVIFNNKPYKIIVLVESCQSEGTSLGSGNSFDYTKWVNN
ncbi:MAG: hypothetical protein ACI4TT_00030 [Christensenellales bacterium]